MRKLRGGTGRDDEESYDRHVKSVSHINLKARRKHWCLPGGKLLRATVQFRKVTCIDLAGKSQVQLAADLVAWSANAHHCDEQEELPEVLQRLKIKADSNPKFAELRETQRLSSWG